jgi:hypothetical protein
MSPETFRHTSGVRHNKSLVSRGGLARTFGSLAGFLVLLFLFVGFYILMDAFTNPIQAGAVAVITAAFIIALAAILLFFLLKPRTSLQRTRFARGSDRPVPDVEMVLSSTARTIPADAGRQDLAYQRSYVDHSQIRQESRSTS